MSTSEPDSSPLDYAPPPPLLKRRSSRRLLVRVVFLLLLISAPFWMPSAAQRLQVLYWQKQCMQFAVAPETVVFETEDAKVQALLASGPQYSNEADGDRKLSTAVASWKPECLQQFLHYGNYGINPWPPVVFVHERTSPRGIGQLVIIRSATWLTYITNDPQPYHRFGVALVEPASFRRDALFFPDEIRLAATALAPHRFTRLYAGQADPADASHFTIRYETDVTSGIIDGWLKDHPQPASRWYGPVHVELKFRDASAH